MVTACAAMLSNSPSETMFSCFCLVADKSTCKSAYRAMAETMLCTVQAASRPPRQGASGSNGPCAIQQVLSNSSSPRNMCNSLILLSGTTAALVPTPAAASSTPADHWMDAQTVTMCRCDMNESLCARLKHQSSRSNLLAVSGRKPKPNR